MNNQIVKINNTDLLVKEFNGQRVVTFKDIDMLHERVDGTAKRNFAENKKHFIENEDYFCINGEELRHLKQSTNFVLSNAKEIILITESGYLMLVKSLQDNLAWKVQRELVNNYFRVKSNLNNQLPSIDIANQMLGLAQSTQMMAQVVQGIQSAIGGIQTYVQDSIQAKDKQIEDIANLVGMRSKNVCSLTGALKKVIATKYGVFNVNSSMDIYKRAKSKVFEEFNIVKWEDIPVCKYSAVQAFIEECV
ncbi:MAG: ORF6N domain-containing protein [Clostridium sp.]|nr:ORF6N domain-containing protein [Clostridium sp.]